jgi:hypothetical protein
VRPASQKVGAKLQRSSVLTWDIRVSLVAPAFTAAWARESRVFILVWKPTTSARA